MKKCLLGLGVAALAAATLVSCGAKQNNTGNVFHIYAWNTEFQGFFNSYLSDEKATFQSIAADLKAKKITDKEAEAKKPAKVHLDGKEVKWTIVPSDNGAYQKSLDEALLANEKATPENKVDMFLAEADYILKYTDSEYTRNVADIGVTDFSNIYNYTKEAASDSKGVVKGVSFQCCPAGVIYRRSIAKDVLGSDDPATVQAAISSWSKFDDVAAKMKAKDYYMVASYAATYRAFSNNVSKPWVDENNKLQFDDQITAWMNQSEKYVQNGYTLKTCPGIWDDECTAQMFNAGRTFCYFGPAWYYNFSMGNAQDPEKGCFGDWGLVEGPAKYFWGGTWMLAAKGGDNDALVQKTMNAFINDYDICYKLVENEGQFANNQKANADYAKTGKGNAFLGGQNDTAVYLELAKGIKFQNITMYDQYCNEGLQKKFAEYLKNPTSVSKEKALANFRDYIKTECPEVKVA